MIRVRFYQDAAGEHRWTISAANGEDLAVSSEGYKKQVDAVNCFRLVTGATVMSAVLPNRDDGKVSYAQRSSDWDSMETIGVEGL